MIEYRWKLVGIGNFAARDGLGLIDFHGRLYIYGGWNPLDKTNFPQISNNEVWSVDTLISADQWTLEDRNADWEPRHSFGLQILDDAVFVVGGDFVQGHYQNDVWFSKDGVNFQLATANVPWGPRILFLTASFDGKLWVMGGQTANDFIASDAPDVFYKDVWSSVDGVTWVQEATDVDFLPRGVIDQIVVHEGYMWVIGGATYETSGHPFVHRNDVWRSLDGVHWEQVLAEAPWDPRRYGAVESYDGKLWLVGGYAYDEDGVGHDLSDTWMSEDGINWIQVPSPFPARHAAGLEVHDGALYLVAGSHLQSDIWKLVPAVILEGTEGSDVLDGAQSDIMIGHDGDDIYDVSGDDEIREIAGEGWDTARASSDYTLSDLVFVERLAVADPSSVTGYRLVGNVLDNVIVGGNGNDVLMGNGGSDDILGGGGNDILDGGDGLDRLTGGPGDDTFYVSAGDKITEFADEGTDILFADTDYQLDAGVAVELMGTRDNFDPSSLNLTGNELSNRIFGNLGKNSLDGAGGDDILEGDGGDDTLVGGAGNDTLFGGVGADILRGDDGRDGLDGGEGDDTLAGGDGNDVLRGGAGADFLTGDAGEDILYGGGSDTLAGGTGNDTYFVSPGDSIVELAGEGVDFVFTEVDYALASAVDVEVLGTVDNFATTAIDLTGNEFSNRLFGNRGVNVLDGGGGADILEGDDGDDTYFVDSDDEVREGEGKGEDIVLARTDFTLASNSHVETLGAAHASSAIGLALTGNNFGNAISGTAGRDTLSGSGGDDTIFGAGNDVLRGGTGNDRYFAIAGDRVVEAAGQGFDTVYATSDFTLAARAEVEVLGTVNNFATTEINLTGNEFANRIFGNMGANVIDGGGGADILEGDDGDDTYYADSDDQVREAADNGYDSLYARGDYALSSASSIEMLAVADPNSTRAIALTGNAFSNTIVGGAGNDFLFGGGARDALFGAGGNDVLDGDGDDILDGGTGDDRYFVRAGDEVVEASGHGRDSLFAKTSYVLSQGIEIEIIGTVDNLATSAIDLTGNALANRIFGNRGSNVIDGGGGADTLEGDAGDDTYYVESDDDVREGVGNGKDTVLARTDFTLSNNSHVEIIALADATSTDPFSLTGNNLDNIIFGGAGDDSLQGRGGNDALRGGGGADRLDAGDGNDTLHGDGDDTLIGGAGDDRYFLTAGDQLIEHVGGGVDYVFASTSYVLTAGAAVEVLGTINNFADTAIDLTGNELANRIFGNLGDNVIDGNGGADILEGDGGDDTYFVDADDEVREAAGKGEDTVLARTDFRLSNNSYVEKLALADQGEAAGRRLTGNNLSNEVIGGAGDDTLRGAEGADVLQGAAGDDQLHGDEGNDILAGGTGDDLLYGGAGDDTFVFDEVAGSDVICDFTPGSDKIDLSNIDAIAASDFRDAFTFIANTAFSNTAGELRYENIAGGVLISGDIDGDGIADFYITVDGIDALDQSDFASEFTSQIQMNFEGSQIHSDLML